MKTSIQVLWVDGPADPPLHRWLEDHGIGPVHAATAAEHGGGADYDIVVVGGNGPDRGFWIEQSMTAQKPCIVWGGAGLGGGTWEKKIRAWQQQGLILHYVGGSDRSTWLDGIDAARPGIGVPLLVEMALDLAVEPSHGNLLQEGGLDLLDAVATAWGPVDSVYARMQNLRNSQRNADWIAALIRFKNGMEGVFNLKALAPKPSSSLQICGSEATYCIKGLALDGQGDNPPLGEALKGLAQGRALDRRFDWPHRGLALGDWIAQAARLDKEVFADEIIRN